MTQVLITIVIVLVVCWVNVKLANSAKSNTLLVRFLVPFLFGVTVLVAWELLVTGLGVPQVILPPPSAIYARIATSTDILWADFIQTFMKGALSGYIIGCGSAFLTAILIDRVPFLKLGLLPVGNFVAALPIVGIAPILVMWFGFDWHSKAAVVVVMVFFSHAGQHRAGPFGDRQHATRPDENLCRRLYGHAPEAAAASGHALCLQWPQDLDDVGLDRGHCGRILRLPHCRYGLPHLNRSGKTRSGHGLGRDHSRGCRRVRILWRGGGHRTGGDLLASFSKRLKPQKI